jgi:hypothetical protein
VKALGHVLSKRHPSDKLARDRFGAAPEPPDNFSLQGFCQETRLQGQLGACESFTMSMAIVACARAAGATTARFASELFIYWITRRQMGTTDQDSGGSFKDTEAAFAVAGVCVEETWPYSDQVTGPSPDGVPTDPFRTDPPAEAWREAADNRLELALHWIDETGAARGRMVRQAISSGCPVGDGFVVDAAFMAGYPADAVIGPSDPMKSQGRHANLYVGYRKNADGTFDYLKKNWWGAGFENNEGWYWVNEAHLAADEELVAIEHSPDLEAA